MTINLIMEDTSYMRVLEQHLKNINLNATYTLLPFKNDTQDRSIRFNLTVNNRNVTGVGRTKKKAKEAAAELMYNRLIDEERKKVQYKNEEATQDPIEALIYLCSRHYLGKPTFAYDSNRIAHHGIMYTVSCTILGLREEVKGFRKDLAKKQAAKAMLMKLMEQEKVHDMYVKLKEEETRKNVSFKLPDGSVNEEAESKLIADVRRKQFSDYLKRSWTAYTMKKEEESYIDEVKDPERLLNRILREIDVKYKIHFHYEDQEWICIIEIFPLMFRMGAAHKDKKEAGKSAVKRVLKYMYSL